MAIYKINSTGQTIVAEAPFMATNYPGNYTLITPDGTIISQNSAPTPQQISAIAMQSYQAAQQYRASKLGANGDIFDALQIIINAKAQQS